MLPTTMTKTGVELLDLHRVQDLVDAFLSGKSVRTIDAYRRDLRGFARHLGMNDINDAAKVLLSQEQGEANHIVLRYRNDLLSRGLSPATVNRRLAAVRSLVDLAKTLGMVNWTLSIKGVKSEAYRDTKGPCIEEVRLMLTALRGRLDSKSVRDCAIVHLLFDLGLRRGEVSSLDATDIDLEAEVVWVVGKGRREKEARSLPESTMDALSAWLDVSGLPKSGPVFTNFDRARKGRRISGRSIDRIVKRLGSQVGIKTSPHGLRHAAITRALDLTGGNVRAVQQFSRHRDVRTLMRYDDNRTDQGGQVAALVAASAK